jgi:hypothetical protein
MSRRIRTAFQNAIQNSSPIDLTGGQGTRWDNVLPLLPTRCMADSCRFVDKRLTRFLLLDLTVSPS